MKLSILVCSIAERLDSSGVIQHLEEQIHNNRLLQEVELIWLGDAMRWSIGEKRQRLLGLASGDYVCFVDDDDRVDDLYVRSLLSGCRSGCDCVTFLARYEANGRPVYYDVKYKEDENLDDKYLRMPNHLCPVKRELALAAGFSDKFFGEDAEYARKLVLKTQSHIEEVLYFYDYNAKTSRSTAGERQRYLSRGSHPRTNRSRR